MRLLIFKPGEWNGRRYSKEFCRALVENYDPQRGVEAPLVVGHRDWSAAARDEDEFAHGWAATLELDNAAQVFAIIPEPSPDIVGWIQTRKLRYVSVELAFDYDQDKSPINPRLIRIAALGRSIPAVPTTRIKASFALAQGGLLVDESDDNTLTAFGRLAWEETDEEDEMGEKNRQPETTSAPSVEELQARLAAAEAKNAELEQADRLRSSEAFMATVGGTGLPPAVRSEAAAFDAGLSDEARGQFRTLLGKMAPVVSLGRKHEADKPAVTAGSLSAQVKAYQREHNIGTFAEAMSALRATRPELFADVEGGEDGDDDEGGTAA